MIDINMPIIDTEDNGKHRNRKQERKVPPAGDNDVTELVFILDRSGSMGGLESDTIGGFNSLLEKQKKSEGRAYVTTVLFDHEAVTLHDRLPIEQVKPMTEKDYQVRGCTALLDAVGQTIHHLKDIYHYIRPEDVPSHTIMVITTDGAENASHKYRKSDVKKMIGECEKKGWEFLFLGANIDAVSVAGDIGIRAERSVRYHNDAEGTALNYAVVNKAVSCLRKDRKLDTSWKEEIEAYEEKNR